jgi:spore germination protein
MTYEWGYIQSEAMPVAPINLVEQVIRYAVTDIPPQKILMGVPNYGYDFDVPKKQGVPATLITNPEAIDIARREGAAIEFNEEAQSPTSTIIMIRRNINRFTSKMPVVFRRKSVLPSNMGLED